MAEPPRSADTGDDAREGPDRGSTTSYPGTPRWVKMFGIIALIMVLLVVVMMVAGGGGHGPGRHMPSSGGDGYTPTVAHGAQRP